MENKTKPEDSFFSSLSLFHRIRITPNGIVLWGSKAPTYKQIFINSLHLNAKYICGELLTTFKFLLFMCVWVVSAFTISSFIVGFTVFSL